MQRLRHVIAVVLFLGLSLALARAADPVEAFLAGEGYAAVDPVTLEQTIEEDLPSTGSVFLAAGSLSPLAKAVHALEALDGVVERARYSLTASLATGSDEVMIQLDRYDLGAAIRQELVDSIGEEHVAPAEKFGMGPHVSLRLVMTRVMGHEAMIVGAARKEIDELAAADGTCLLGACLELARSAEHVGQLEDLGEQYVESDLPYQAERDGLPTPAALLDMLSDYAGLVLYDNEARFEFQGSNLQVAEAVIDSNLAQEGSVDGVMRVDALLDDSLAATWHRLVALPGWSVGAPLYGASALECRRGEPTAGLCP